MTPRFESPLNLTWIESDFAVGGSFCAKQLKTLAGELQIRHVVDARAEARDDQRALGQHGLELFHCPALDHHAHSLAELESAVSWVLERLRRGERVLVHCEHGIGRSVLIALCVLVRTGAHAPEQASRRVKERRPCASPSPLQLERFVQFCACRAQVCTWEQLAAVFYG
jgi:protein-tyrosine phosphatase